ARANWRGSLSKWRWALLGIGLAPSTLIAVFRQSIFPGQTYLRDAARWSLPFGWAGLALEFFFLSVSILIVFNLERTIRSSTGRTRWQIKFMALGAAGLFGLRIYLSSQALLFSSLDTGFETSYALSLIAANVLFAFSLSRSRSLQVDVYLSRASIQNSLTIIFAGMYLLGVGVIARLARYWEAGRLLSLDAFVVFGSLTVLAVLLLSNRLRRHLLLFVTN